MRSELRNSGSLSQIAQERKEDRVENFVNFYSQKHLYLLYLRKFLGERV